MNLVQKLMGRRSKGRYEMDMTNGPLLGKIIKFAIPLALSGVLQLLFNAADMVVVGQFNGPTALAAVGSTGALNQLIINLFIGLSVGVNVLVARYYGAGKGKDLRETVHTAVLISIVGGAVLIFVGIFLSRPLLELMETPPDVIDQSVLYMRIYFSGMPVIMLYNFGSAILRAVGDTKRPLYFLFIAGVINVCFNLVAVIIFKMGVAGVALATVISQAVSAALVLMCLIKSDGPYNVRLKELRIHKDKLIGMTKIGIPAGIQGATFSISNVIIQSSINSFGSIAMAGATAGGNIEGFVFTGMDAFTQAALSFTGQNLGAKKYDRINKVMRNCMLLSTLVGFVLGVAAYLCSDFLLRIYVTDPVSIEYGQTRMMIVGVTYFTCGMMNVIMGCLRGMGSSVLPMCVSIGGICVLRVVWIYTVFAAYHSFEVLFASYPISWVLTAAVGMVCYAVVKRRVTKKGMEEARQTG